MLITIIPPAYIVLQSKCSVYDAAGNISYGRTVHIA